MDYMLVARSKSADGFSNELGAVYFLGVPSDDDTLKFRHKMSPRAWRDAVLERASSGTRNTQTTGDIVFYVHGYNNSQETVLERQRKLQRGLERNGFDGVVVSFDWPSADNVLNYLEDRHDAKKVSIDVGETWHSRIRKDARARMQNRYACSGAFHGGICRARGI